MVEANSIVNHQRVVNVVTVTLALALKRVFNRRAYDISAEACVSCRLVMWTREVSARFWQTSRTLVSLAGSNLASSIIRATTLRSWAQITLTWKMCCA